MFIFLDQLSAGSPVRYETEILTAGGDTVLHVLDDAAPFPQLAASDDCRPPPGPTPPPPPPHGPPFGHAVGLRSCLTFTPSRSMRVRVLVRAGDNRSSGRANLLKNGIVVAHDIQFAGTQVRSAWVANDVFETPLQSPAKFPGASADTQLLLIRDPPLGLVAYDDDSSPGLGARVVAPAAFNGAPTTAPLASYLVVASVNPATAGPARLVQNDVLHSDSDGDGLGDLLEGFRDPAEFLPTDPTRADSDGDGIKDGWELLGRDGSHPQLLPRWGANPRHRDLFIEIDRDGSGPTAGATLSPAHVQALAARLSLWPNSELQNFDGRDGVAVHVDNGIPSNDDSFGDLGGSEELTDTGDLQQAYAQHFVAERAGIFKYAFAKSGCEEVTHLYGDRVVFASTCGDFAWKNLVYNLSRNLHWGASCCDFRRF
ncbi:MAG: hypothetical protein ACYC8T_17805 [Myxococcaceae bacterium]